MKRIKTFLVFGLIAGLIASGINTLVTTKEAHADQNRWSGTCRFDYNVDSTSFNTDTSAIVGVFSGLANKEKLSGLISIAYFSLDTGTAGATDFLDTTKDTVWALIEASNNENSYWWTVSKVKYTAFKVLESRTWVPFTVPDTVLGDKLRISCIVSSTDSDFTVARNAGGATFDVQAFLWAK